MGFIGRVQDTLSSEFAENIILVLLGGLLYFIGLVNISPYLGTENLDIFDPAFLLALSFLVVGLIGIAVGIIQLIQD